MKSDIPDFPHPIFVGGSARSGSHAMGRLLESHPRYHLLDVEARLHCSRGGLADLLKGETDLDAFCERTMTEWWRRGLRHNRGLRTIVDRPTLVTALDEFRAGYDDDPWAAGRRLIHAVLDPSAERAGRPTWVDLSGSNIRQGPVLAKLFPEARFIHMVRDGRAVAAALLRKRLATDDRATAFRHWVKRIRRSHVGIGQMPRERIETILLEDLSAHDREGSFERLVRLLELDDPAPMREYFDREISPERAHVGAWRERIAPDDVRWLDRQYRRTVRRLHGEGIDWIPDPARE